MTRSDVLLEKVVVGPLQTNCYILGSKATSEAIVIDPGAQPQEIKNQLKKHHLKIKCIVNTHAHFDHVGANDQFFAPVYIHQLDAKILNSRASYLENGQKIKAGDISLTVIHTPGHTPGGICLNQGKFCFTGDTLFAQGVGRTDFAYGSQEDLFNSIRDKLFTLPDELVIYPGHGPSSTIGEERKNNPFI